MIAAPELLGDLLLAVGRGDARALRRLYELSSSHLLGILIGKIGQRELAEDALQECFIKIWQKAGSYDPARGPAIAWLVTLVRNQAIDTLRARRPDEPIADLDSALAELVDDGADPLRDAEQAQSLARLRAPLDALSPQMRRSVLLTCYAGYSHSESAELMQAPIGTLKSWVRRGLEQLRTRVEPQGEGSAC